MENSDVKSNVLTSDLSEPARSIFEVIVLLQKIRNHLLSLKKKISDLFLKAKATHFETDDSQVESRASQEGRQFPFYHNPKNNS